MTENEITEILKDGGVGVLATDTLYGIVGQALNKETVTRIYKIKGRAPEKPLIILISDQNQLKVLGVELTPKAEEILGEVWPGPVSVVLAIESENFEYLDRGTRTLAFRLPKSKRLTEIINETGPLVAPSANPEGSEPAKNIKEARDYFGTLVDFYSDSGRIDGEPSTLIRIKNDGIEVLRRGSGRKI